MVLALNKISGQIADVSPKLLEHPKFKDVLEVVEPWFEPKNTKNATKTTKKEKPVVEDVQVISEDDDVVETVISEIEEDN